MGTSDFWSQSNKWHQFNQDLFKKNDNLDIDELSEKLSINKLMLHSLFEQADTDGDGKISQNNGENHNEMQSLLNSLNAKFSLKIDKKGNENNVYEYTDNNGNQITEEYDNFGKLLSKTVKKAVSQDAATAGQEDFDSVKYTYNEGKIAKKEIKKDGKTIEKLKYTYNSSENKTGFVTINSEKEDGSEETINTLVVDNDGNTYGFAILSYYKKDANGETSVVKTEQGVQETVLDKDGNGKVKLYRSFDAMNYSKAPLLAERYVKDNKAYDVQYDGKGNSVVFAKNNDSFEGIAKRFGISVAELHKLNPKIKTLKIGDAVIVKGVWASDSKQVIAQGDRNIEMKKYNKYVAEPEYIYTHNYSKIDRNIYDQLNKVFKVGQDNHIFYLRFNELKPEQQRNAINVIKYCVSRRITDPEQIKAEILKVFPEINLFDSGRSIPIKKQGVNSPVFQKSNAVLSLEQFVKDVLKLDIKNGEGKELYSRLSAQGQEVLNKISVDDFRNLKNPTAANVVDILETMGVNLRDRHEITRRRNQEVTCKRFAAQMLSNIYRQAAQLLHNHLHTKGLASLAAEDLRIVVDAAAQHFTDFFKCEPRLIAEYERLADKFEKNADSASFAHDFEKATNGFPYNERAIQNLMEVYEETNGDMNSEKFKSACKKAFGFRGLENTENNISIEDNIGFIGDAVAMVYTMGAYAESKAGQYFTQGLKNGLQSILTSHFGYGKVGQYVAQKGAAIATNAYISAGTMGGFSGVSRILLNSPDLLGADWNMASEEMFGSAGFGTFAGVWGEVAVAPYMKFVQRALPKTQKAVSNFLKSNSKMSGKQVMDLFIKYQNPGTLVKLSSVLPEAFGFGGYEAAIMAIENEPDPETGKKLSDMTYDEAMSYVKRSLGNQFKQLSVFKAAGWFVMLRKGGSMLQKAALQHMMEETKALKDVNITTESFNGEEFYVVESHGQKFATKNINDVIEFCQVSLAHGTYAPIIMTKGEEGYQEALEFDFAKKVEKHFEEKNEPFKLGDDRVITRDKSGIYHLVYKVEGKEYALRADSVEKFFKIGTEYVVDETGTLVEAEVKGVKAGVNGANGANGNGAKLSLNDLFTACDNKFREQYSIKENESIYTPEEKAQIQELYKRYPKEISELLNSQANIKFYIDPKQHFSPKLLEKMIEISKKYPKLYEKFIKYGANLEYIYQNNELQYFEQAYAKNPELADELFGMKDERNCSRFWGPTLLTVLENMDNPKVKDMVYAKVQRNGKEQYAFEGYHIVQSIENKLDNIVITLMQLKTFDGKYRLFSSDDMTYAKSALENNPKLIEDLKNPQTSNKAKKELLIESHNIVSQVIYDYPGLKDVLLDVMPENTYTIDINSKSSDGTFRFICNSNDITITIRIKQNSNGGFDILSKESRRDEGNISHVWVEFADGRTQTEDIEYGKLESGGKESRVAINLTKTLYDKHGEPIYQEKTVQTGNVAGFYNIEGAERGNTPLKGVVQTDAAKNSKTRITKEYTHSNGMKTVSTIVLSENGSTSTYKVIGKNNKTIVNTERTITQISENHHRSSLNGQNYDIVLDGDKVIVSRLDKNGKKVETITLGNDMLDPGLKELYKTLPGDFFFMIKKAGIKRVELFDGISGVTYDGIIQMSKDDLKNPFVLAHELGHVIDVVFLDNLFKNPALKQIFLKEFGKYQQSASYEENKIIDYFTEKEDDAYTGIVGRKLSYLQEIIAETHALFTGLSNDKSLVAHRGIELQKHFPETMTYIMEKLSRLYEQVNDGTLKQSKYEADTNVSQSITAHDAEVGVSNAGSAQTTPDNQSSSGMAMSTIFPFVPSQRLINHAKQTWNRFVQRFSSKKEAETLKEIDSAIEKLIKSNPKYYTKDVTDCLKAAVIEGAEENPALLAKRLEILKNPKLKDSLYMVAFSNVENPKTIAFVFDNIVEIENIIKQKNIKSESKYRLLEGINETSLGMLRALAETSNSENADFVSEFDYLQRNHDIKFGKEKVTVSSKEIIALLSGKQNVSVSEIGSFDTFHATVEALVAKGHYNGKTEQYFMIAEGILAQRPELVGVVERFREFENSLEKDNVLPDVKMQKRAEFFAQLAKEGVLPEQIEFRTIIPDNNALKAPMQTVKLFKQGMTATPNTRYAIASNIVFEVKPDDITKNPARIEEAQIAIDELRKTNPQEADELQIVLDMFKNPTKDVDVTERQYEAVVNFLDKHYAQKENYLTLQVMSLGLDKLGRFGQRMKSEASTRDKVENYIKDSINKGKGKTLLDAYRDVRDKYACRTVFGSVDYMSYPEVVEILEKGNYSAEARRKAELRAAEIQGEVVLEKLRETIRAAKEGGADLAAIRISNYSSDNGIPILSAEQLLALKRYGVQHGVDVSYIQVEEQIDPNTKQRNIVGEVTKTQDSGYTALQVNFQTRNGEVIEWQYRDEVVDGISDAEHIDYNARTGKRPWAHNPALKPLYEPVIEMLAKMPDEVHERLNQYFTDYYAYGRRLSQKQKVTPPRLEDYEVYTDANGQTQRYHFDRRLTVENLKKLHEVEEDFKAGRIAEENMVSEYHKRIGAKVLEGGVLDINLDNTPLQENVNNFVLNQNGTVNSDIATDADLQIIHQIDLENFKGRGYGIPTDFEAYKADLEEQGITTHALKDATGKVLGYYQLEPINGNEVYIYSIGVSKELQNTRASYSALLKMQEDITNLAKTQGLKKVVLDVEPDNKALLKLYTKFGFEQKGKTSYGDIHMEADVDKVLAAQKEAVKSQTAQEKAKNLAGMEDFRKQKNVFGKDFTNVQLEILSRIFDKKNGAVADNKFEVFKKLITVENLTADNIIELLLSDKVKLNELYNIEKYLQIAKEKGLDIVKLMESGEEDFNTYVQSENERINFGVQKIEEPSNKVQVTDNWQYLEEQLFKLTGHQGNMLREALKNLTKEQVVELSAFLSHKNKLDSFNGSDVRDCVEMLGKIKAEDKDIMYTCLELGWSNSRINDLLDEVINNNPSRREAVIETLKLLKQQNRLYDLDASISYNGSNNVLYHNYWTEVVKQIETPEQLDAYKSYIKNTPYHKLSYSNIPDMTRVKNSADMDAWKQLSEYYSLFRKSVFVDTYLAMTPEDRALFTDSQFRADDMSVRSNDGNIGISRILQIAEKLTDSNVSDRDKANIREFLKLNTDANMRLKWDLCLCDGEFMPEHLERILKFDRTGIEYAIINESKYCDLVSGYKQEDGTFFYPYTDEQINGWLSVITDKNISDKLGRKVTIEEAEDFYNIKESWKKEYVLSKLGPQSNFTQLIKAVDHIATKEQLALFDVLKIQDRWSEFFAIPVENGEPITLNNDTVKQLTDPSDIEAFCSFLKNPPKNTGIAPQMFLKKVLQYEYGGVYKSGNLKPILDVFRNMTNISKMDDETFTNFICLTKNQYQAEAIKLLDKLVEEHPEYIQKCRLLTHKIDKHGYSDNNGVCFIDKITSQEILDRVSKNIETLRKFGKEGADCLPKNRRYTDDKTMGDVLLSANLTAEKLSAVSKLEMNVFDKTKLLAFYIDNETLFKIMQKHTSHSVDICELCTEQNYELFKLLVDDPWYTDMWDYSNALAIDCYGEVNPNDFAAKQRIYSTYRNTSGFNKDGFIKLISAIDENNEFLAAKLIRDRELNLDVNELGHLLNGIRGRNIVIKGLDNDAVYEKFRQSIAGKDINIQNLISSIIYAQTDVDYRQYVQAYSDAKAKKDQIKAFGEDLTDQDIKNFFKKNEQAIIYTIGTIGLPAFEYSFTSKKKGMETLFNAVMDLKQNLSPDLFREIKERLSDKTIEPQYRIQKLRTLSGLRKYCTEDEYKNFVHLIKSNAPTMEEITSAKEIWNDTKFWNRNKELTFEQKFEQKLKDFCEKFGINTNDAKVRSFFEKRIAVDKQGNKFFKGVKDNDITRFLADIIKRRNDNAWNKAIYERIFALASVPYSPELAAKLDIMDSPHLGSIFMGSPQFMATFKVMIEKLNEHPELNVRQLFDQLAQNIETKKQYEQWGIPYDRFVNADKNSFKELKVVLSAEQAKNDALSSLEAEFNDIAFKSLPKEETDKILKALAEIQIFAKTQKVAVYDTEAGFLQGQKEVLKFYNQNDEPIKFEDLSKMMKVIKQVMNDNAFWNQKHEDSTIQGHKENFWSHMTKDRDPEIKKAAEMKGDKISELDIHQTDMNDIAKALFLGNGLCCTGVGSGCNQYSAPTYVMNKCISAIEVTDGKNVVGNTMCYFAEIDGKLTFVLDNIEMQPGYKKDIIRDAFMDYAKQLCSELGLPDVQILAGPNRHKFDMTVYPIEQHNVKIIGSTGDDNIYIDYKGKFNTDGTAMIPNVSMYRIR